MNLYNLNPQDWPIDNPVCFVCELAPTQVVGTYFFCNRHPGGEVRWVKYNLRYPDWKDNCTYLGKTLNYVDFTRPGALSSPA
jgi:hypothetical protein